MIENGIKFELKIHVFVGFSILITVMFLVQEKVTILVKVLLFRNLGSSCIIEIIMILMTIERWIVVC